jgi:hypothetical protein
MYEPGTPRSPSRAARARFRHGNGQFVFSITTDPPPPLPPTPTCPNEMWTPEIVDVSFTTATLTLFEDGVQTDQVVVPVT